MKRIRIVNGNTELKAILAPIVARSAVGKGVRENERVSDFPIVVVFRMALEHAALDDSVREFVEAYFEMML